MMTHKALAAGLVPAAEPQEEQQAAPPSPEDVRCMEEGGCAVFTRREFERALREAAEIGRRHGIVEGRKQCLLKTS